MISALSAAVSCASLIGVVFRPHLLFAVLTAVALGATVIAIIFLFRIVGGRARLDRDFQEIRLDLSRLELAGKSVAETMAVIQRFDESHRKGQGEINGLGQDRSVLKREIDDIISRAVPELERTIASDGSIIAEIQKSSGCKTIEELGERLIAKREAESTVTRQITILTGLFEKGSGDNKKDIDLWHARVSELSLYRDKAPDVEFTEQIYQEKQDKKRAAEQRRDDVTSSLLAFRKRFEEVERQANTVLATKDEYINCDTSSDLASIAAKLSAFVRSMRKDGAQLWSQ